MRIDIRVHTDHITTDDLAVFAALAALTPGTPTPTTAVLNGVKGAPEVSPEPARPAARKAAPKAKPAPAPELEPVEAKPAEDLSRLSPQRSRPRPSSQRPSEN